MEGLRKEKPLSMLIQETKIAGRKMDEIQNKIELKYECMLIDVKGSARGITILWLPTDITVDYWIGMKWILIEQFLVIGNREWFLVVAVYHPDTSVERGSFLLQLHQLGKLYKEKLSMIAGDFNLTTSIEEKKGGLQREELEMDRFNDLQEKLKLVDIPTINGKDPWNNGRGENRQVASRLEKFLATKSFIRKHIFYEATILPCLGLDHWPIKLEIAMNHQNQNRPFRFEAFWLREPTFIDKMKNWWKETKTTMEGRNQIHTLQLRLKDLKGRRKKWNREEFGNIQKEQETLQINMKQIQHKIIEEGRSEELVEEEGLVLNNLEERRKQEEVLWKKKSRIQCLKEG